jgi:hypothetical protein
VRACIVAIGMAWAGVADAAPCEGRAVAAATETAGERVLAADVLGFERAVDQLGAELACLREPIARSTAAGARLTLGLWHWAHREDDAAVASMFAARLADPARTLPDAFFPVGDALPAVTRVLMPDDPLPSPPWVGRTRRDPGVAGGVLAATAAGLYAGARVAHGSFRSRAPDDIPGLERDAGVASGLTVASAVAALVASAPG